MSSVFLVSIPKFTQAIVPRGRFGQKNRGFGGEWGYLTHWFYWFPV